VVVVAAAAAAAVKWGAGRALVFLFIFFENLCRVSVYSTRQICHMVWGTEMAVFFCRELGKTHGKEFAECPIKDTRQMSYLPADLCRVLFTVCIWAFAVCLGTLQTACVP